MAQIADVIKYEGDNETFVWKHPLEDFNSMSQLIVHESQEAIFFMNGQALDLFGAGRYTLETENIPQIGKFLNRTTGTQSPFHCEVYFINKTEQMAIKWGTDSKVQYMDPVYGFPLSIGACGEMSLRAEDSRKLLVKLVGTEDDFGREKLSDYFRALLMTKIKSYIAQTMKEKAINIFEIDARLEEFSVDLRKRLMADFAEYGVALEKFWVTTVLKPDGEPQYERFKELHFRQYADVAEASLQQKVGIIQAQTEAQKELIASQGRAAVRRQEGYTYQQERGFDTMEAIARNEGSGADVRNAAMGIGIGFGAGGAFGNTINNIANNTLGGLMEPVGKADVEDVQPDIPGRISLKSEKQPENAEDDMTGFEKKIKKLAMMKENGLLSEEEFEEQKKLLLSQL